MVYIYMIGCAKQKVADAAAAVHYYTLGRRERERMSQEESQSPMLPRARKEAAAVIRYITTYTAVCVCGLTIYSV